MDAKTRFLPGLQGLQSSNHLLTRSSLHTSCSHDRDVGGVQQACCGREGRERGRA
eukprot:CAMPEP_0115136476 /NCGR_PEP_ID=MMETSP0227-20121206/56404_1 /TAXON_ID=89957 /ORGANISM="Polarella glacialis, Strain CCMP 1383" /LENGTH=54 /DNA_ID=CAMNT_0002543533 /DNA_START=85 /DNA_END=245 /DNA_ORIENTATION=-